MNTHLPRLPSSVYKGKTLRAFTSSVRLVAGRQPWHLSSGPGLRGLSATPSWTVQCASSTLDTPSANLVTMAGDQAADEQGPAADAGAAAATKTAEGKQQGNGKQKQGKQPVTQELLRYKAEAKRKQQLAQAARVAAMTDEERADMERKKKERKEREAKREAKAPPTVKLTQVISMAAKDENLEKALAAYRQAQAEGLSLPLHVFNTLFYLTVGGNMWEAVARGGDPTLLAIDNVRTATTGPAPALDTSLNNPQEPAATTTVAATNSTGSQGPAPAAAAVEGQQGVVEGAGTQESQPSASGELQGAALNVVMPRSERVALANELWAAVQAAGHTPDDRSYLALARLEALNRQPDKAFDWAKQAVAKGCSVNIRLYHPAFVGYCMHRDGQGLARLVEWITEQHKDIDLLEYEFSRLLEGYMSDTRTPWSTIQDLLLRMGKELEGLQASTVDLIDAYFTSPQSAAALNAPPPPSPAPRPNKPPRSPRRSKAQPASDAAGDAQVSGGEEGSGGEGEPHAKRQRMCPPPEAHQWKVSRTKVDEQGFCEDAGATLRVMDLEDEEWETFAEAIAKLAKGMEKSRNGKSNFDAYREWYDRHGPYDILIDGANVAFYGANGIHNPNAGQFQWSQIMTMWDHVKAKHPDKKVLLMLHAGRMHGPESKAPEAQSFIQRLKERRSIYSTPPGSNDDWYWLYATVASRHQGLLVSNDELRDHIFNLLRPKHFLKWKARHIAQYHWRVVGEQFALDYPPLYTTCIQRLDNGAWMFPRAEDKTWLCCRPV